MTEIFAEIAVAVYNIAVMIGVVFLAIVVTQAHNDLHLKRNERPVLRVARRNAFYADAAFILVTAVLQKYWLIRLQPWEVIAVSTVLSGYIAGGLWILIVNSASLRERVPQPPSQSGFRASTALAWRRIAPWKH